MKNYFTLLLLFGVLFMTSCSKDKDNVPENDVISFTVNGPGLNNYEFKTNGFGGKIVGASVMVNDITSVSTLTSSNDNTCAIGFYAATTGTYPLVEESNFNFSNPNTAHIGATFTHNGISYLINSIDGSLVLNSIDLMPNPSIPTAGTVGAHGTFSGSFINEDGQTYQITNGVFKFSKN